jgi:hypothetical protein
LRCSLGHASPPGSAHSCGSTCPPPPASGYRPPRSAPSVLFNTSSPCTGPCGARAGSGPCRSPFTGPSGARDWEVPVPQSLHWPSGPCGARAGSGPCRSPCTGPSGACARIGPCYSIPCTGPSGARAGRDWACARRSDLCKDRAWQGPPFHISDHLPETHAAHRPCVSSHWHPVDLPTSPTKLRANSGTGATPVVPPVLQPWTSCAKRKSQYGKASAYIYIYIYIYIYMGC